MIDRNVSGYAAMPASGLNAKRLSRRSGRWCGLGADSEDRLERA
jgi:hypothetical protein